MAARGAGRKAPSPITRDLTSDFIKHRREHKALSKSRSGYNLLNGGDVEQGGAGDSDGAPSVFSRAMLPPKWHDAGDEAQADIVKIEKEKLPELRKAITKRLKEVMANDNIPDKDIEVFSTNINRLIRRCEQNIHQIKLVDGGSMTPGEQEYRTNYQRSLATQVSQLSKQTRQAMKDYSDEIRRRQGGGRAGDPLLPSASASGSGSSASRGGLQMQSAQNDELDRLEAFAVERSNGACQIASTMNEVNMAFKELAVLVIDQGTVLDRIDYNMEQMVEKSTQANLQLKKAEKTQKSTDDRAFKCMLLLALFNCILLFVVMLKIKLKFGWSFVQMFIFLAYMGVVGGAAFTLVRYRPQWCHAACPKIAGTCLPGTTNPNSKDDGRLSRWVGQAKSAVGIPQGVPLRHVGMAAQGMRAAQGIAGTVTGR